MSNLHPHWESDGEEIPVRVHEQRPSKEVKTVSRQPAAIVGILTVVAGGYIFFQGVTSLTGQVINEDHRVTVHITEDGLDPATIEVEHGETITWQNDQAIPHTLTSDTLCSDTGFCLQTKNLSEGDSDNFTITMDMEAGTYTYSSSEGNIQGNVVITTTATKEYNTVFEEVPPTPVDPPVTSPSPFEAPETQVLADIQTTAKIPHNPYTNDSQRIHPFDAQGNPIESAFGDLPTKADPSPIVNRNGYKPVSQPTTGAGGTWALVFGSVFILWYMTRRNFLKA